ncbi:hypothetical protein OHB53_08515 [Streptomyces sp. NBC_00056]|uniref:hypothetical protein n=1 Tax=Streptomyces sp. NBC_00056 TaxID=2975633 RepID=UPI00324B2F91
MGICGVSPAVTLAEAVPTRAYALLFILHTGCLRIESLLNLAGALEHSVRRRPAHRLLLP